MDSPGVPINVEVRYFTIHLSQTSFGHISTNSLTILTVLTATESP